MRTKLLRAGRYLLLLIPGVLGVIGLHVLARPALSLSDALYNTLGMYIINYGDAPPNALADAARWTAPLCTASGVFLTIRAVRDWLRCRLLYRSGHSTAVYGPAEDKQRILSQLGRYGIDGGERLVRARRYILLQPEEEAFRFYERELASLPDAEVYIRCSRLTAQAVSGRRLHLFCPEEAAARTFWTQRDMYPMSAACGHRMQIVLLGFGTLGEQVLSYALMYNVFSPDQRIEYHVFGDGTHYRAVHTQLGAISDPVVFHDEPWYEQTALLEQAALVLVLTQDGQTALLHDLLQTTVRTRFDVFADGGTPALLDGSARLALFSWREQASRLENICTDRLIRDAKRLNHRYACLYQGAPDTDSACDAAWQELNAFTRSSNISAADYNAVRLAMLAAMGQDPDPDRMPPELLDRLAELEHIRWCRFHLLQNWRFGIPEGGGSKDPVRRLHADLVPYGQLEPSERDKDRQSVRLLLDLARAGR